MTTPDASNAPSAANSSSSSPAKAEGPRRNFLVEALTVCCSIVLVAVPSVIGGLFFLDPLLRKDGEDAGAASGGNRRDEAGFIRLETTRAAIPDDGTPVAVTVIDDLTDAWNRFPNVPVGSVWLRKIQDQVIAFSSVCPHLGCSVDYRRSNNDFFCPCHTSAFSLDGKKTNRVPPRDMDTLEVSIRTDGKEDPAGTEIWVKYQNFVKATEEKIPV
jgi:Rieske Fe-S protein